MLNAPLISEAGGAHIEANFKVYANMSEEEFIHECDVLHSTSLTVISMNNMLPSNFTLHGTEEQTQEVCDFVRSGLQRAAALGCKIVCMGAGSARNIPEGMSRNEATDRFVALIARFCAMAAEYDIKIAIEPIRKAETNFINTVADAYDIVRRLPEYNNLGINPDMFHMYEEGDDFSNLMKYKDYVFNVHMAEPGTRLYPKPASEEIQALYIQFLTALKDAGYMGNVSFEAHVKDFKADATVAFKYLGELAANI
jgi:sugar phosphate isomerase/epimerase